MDQKKSLKFCIDVIGAQDANGNLDWPKLWGSFLEVLRSLKDLTTCICWVVVGLAILSTMIPFQVHQSNEEYVWFQVFLSFLIKSRWRKKAADVHVVPCQLAIKRLKANVQTWPCDHAAIYIPFKWSCYMLEEYPSLFKMLNLKKSYGIYGRPYMYIYILYIYIY